jgi:hypothetical protein
MQEGNIDIEDLQEEEEEEEGGQEEWMARMAMGEEALSGWRRGGTKHPSEPVGSNSQRSQRPDSNTQSQDLSCSICGDFVPSEERIRIDSCRHNSSARAVFVPGCACTVAQPVLSVVPASKSLRRRMGKFKSRTCRRRKGERGGGEEWLEERWLVPELEAETPALYSDQMMGYKQILW